MSHNQQNGVKVDLDYGAMNICDSCNNLTMKRSIGIHMSQQYMHELYWGQRKSKKRLKGKTDDNKAIFTIDGAMSKGMSNHYVHAKLH